MAKLERITQCPAAFLPFARAHNQLVDEMERRRLEAGPGIKLTETDNGTKIEVANLSGELTCEEEGGDIVIYAD